MLNKEICMKCRALAIKTGDQAVGLHYFGDIWKWEKSDDTRWNTIHKVWCVFVPKREEASTEESPPEWCPFALEHVVQE